jgi:lipoyl(octanoyl) transferase
MISSRSCHLYCPGCKEYGDALTFQNKLANMRLQGEIPDSLVLLEHPPTYTLGRKSNRDHFRVPRDWIDNGRVSVHEVDRGGQITFHGPGQLVGYPVIKLDGGNKQIVQYIRKLESMLVVALRSLGIDGRTQKNTRLSPPSTGVWVSDEKIAAIGIKVNGNMVTTHGFALNINTDLDYFEKIIPCGMKDKTITSVERCLGHPIPMALAINKVVMAFAEVFHFEFTEQYGTYVA